MPVMTTEKLVQASGWKTTDLTQLPDSSFAFVASDGTRLLPYRDESGTAYLPLVRNALAALDTEAAIPTDKRSDIRSSLQNSLKTIQASDTSDVGFSSVNVIAADSNGNLPSKIMLLRAGTFHTEKYGEIPISVEDLHEMKANNDKGIGMAGSGETGIPVDFAHQSHLNAGAWLKKLDVEGDALYATDVEYSGSGRKALMDKEYKMISADFYPKSFGEWVDAESGVRAQNVIAGAGFTNKPMFTGNTPVMASENDDNAGGGKSTKTIVYINASQTKETSMNLDLVRVKAADEVTGSEQRFLQANADKLSEAEKKRFEIVASEAAVVATTNVIGTEGTVQVNAAELKAQNDKVTNLEASVTGLQTSVKAFQEKDAEAFVDEQIGQGKIVATEKPAWVKAVLADDSNREMLEKLPGSKLLGQKQGGNSAEAADESPREKQTRLAKELMASDSEWKTKGIKAAMDHIAETTDGLSEAIADENKALAGVKGSAV